MHSSVPQEGPPIRPGGQLTYSSLTFHCSSWILLLRWRYFPRLILMGTVWLPAVNSCPWICITEILFVPAALFSTFWDYKFDFGWASYVFFHTHENQLTLQYHPRCDVVNKHKVCINKYYLFKYISNIWMTRLAQWLSNRLLRYQPRLWFPHGQIFVWPTYICSGSWCLCMWIVCL